MSRLMTKNPKAVSAITLSLLVCSLAGAASPIEQARRIAEGTEADQQQVLRQTGDNSAANAGIAPFRAAADKIFRGIQTASFNQADYSARLVQSIPAGVDFNQVMVMTVQTMTQQHGMIVSVNEGKLQTPNIALFDVTTANGKADLVVMLDEEGKILNWNLAAKQTSQDVPLVQPSRTAPSVTPAVPADVNDFNDFELPLRRTEIARRNEQRTWVTSSGKPQDMAEAAYTSAKTDLEFLREVAQSEGCSRTIAAIDMLLAERETVYAEVTERLEQQLREDRERLREERRAARTRDDGDTGRTTRTRRSRTRDRDQTDPQQQQPPQY